MVARHADEAVRTTSVGEAAQAQKAAAWQWYARGGGEALVLMPPRPTVAKLPAPARNHKSCVGATNRPRSKEGDSPVYDDGNILQKKVVDQPSLAQSATPASLHFKAEACLGAARSAASASSQAALDGPPPSLYDDLELASLRIHMADFVQRLQHQHNQHSKHSVAGGDHEKSDAPFPSPSVSLEGPQTRAPPAVAATSSTDRLHRLRMLSPSPPPVASTIPLHMRPFFVLQKLFRKALCGSVPKFTKNLSQTFNSSPAGSLCDPSEALHDYADSSAQHHHHHYIHHHHHHHHYSESPEQQASITLRGRRHSESWSSRQSTPSLAEGESNEEDDEAEGGRIKAYLAHRRRRHSHNFPNYQRLPEKTGSDKDEGFREESAKVELPVQSSSRYNSEMFSPSRVSAMASCKEITHPVAGRKLDELDAGTFVATRSRRRHSADFDWTEASLEQTGGKREGRAYKLGGAGAGGATTGSMPVAVKWRHSESSDFKLDEGGKRTASQVSSSARYSVDLQRRHTDHNEEILWTIVK